MSNCRMSENEKTEAARLLFEAHGPMAQVLARRAADLLKEDVDLAEHAAWWEDVLGAIQELLGGKEPVDTA